jgi:hypothetical protein
MRAERWTFPKLRRGLGCGRPSPDNLRLAFAATLRASSPLFEKRPIFTTAGAGEIEIPTAESKTGRTLSDFSAHSEYRVKFIAGRDRVHEKPAKRLTPVNVLQVREASKFR